MRREVSLDKLRRGESFDLVVVGGGINGAGIARDARARGLSVALLERGDWASGTSSRSSRLVHGGLRYLEQGALGRVREALRERETLLRIAPHLVRPIRFVAPAWGDSRYGLTALGVGLGIYDLLAGRRRMGLRERIAPAELSELEPELRRDRLQGAIAFQDAATDDARLVLSTVRSAWLAGAATVNYMAVESLRHEGGVVRGVNAVDQMSGERFELDARAVINATGPWAARTAELDGEKRSFLRLTRGAHLVIRRSSRQALLLPTRDGRVLFVLPAGALTILGTTDVDHHGSIDEVAATEADAGFLLDEAQALLPRAALTRDSVVASWAALRPLASGSGPPGALSREHRIERGRSGLISVIGGKLTTFRALAAAVVDRAAREIGQKIAASPTDRLAIDGGEIPDLAAFLGEASAELRGRLHLPAEQGERLAHSYGTRVHNLLKLAEEEPALIARLCPGHPHLALEAAYAARDEMAMTLSDFLFRRTRIAYQACRGVDCAEAAAEAMAAANGWGKARQDAEVRAFAEEASRLTLPR